MIGIVNLEVYFPSTYVDQSELECHDGVSSGKYTVGLGQTKMSFCTDLEDVNSLCLTAVNNLIRKSGVSYSDIGRLEVGTETLVDKSKSVKSVLMRLFAESGNTDVEGVDVTNACYGGTAAMFNCIDWCRESADYDGRYAVAVCADIAVYSEGNARPTGGAGAVAMLIGRDAALVLDRGLRATHVEDVYDFYKPNLSSEYPVVDGPLSIQCYLKALDKCYQLYCQKAAAVGGINGTVKSVTLDHFDSLLFHAPFCKLVQKSLGRLALNDFVRSPKAQRVGTLGAAFASVSLEDSYFDKDVEKAFLKHSLADFESKTKPSLLLATNVGNMYTPSLYCGLASFLYATPEAELPGKRIGLFSYGSGLVASFFSLTVTDQTDMIKKSLADLEERLEARTKVSPAEFVRVLLLREEMEAPFVPRTDPAGLFPGTWHLAKVDERHRRDYAVVPQLPKIQNGH